MTVPLLRSIWLGALTAAVLTLVSTTGAAEALQYNRDIRPLLSDRCFKCHGPDKNSRKASLRLDLAQEAYAERKKSGKHAIVPGKPEASLLVEKIFSSDADELMPPAESNLSLQPEEKERLRRWIVEGAQYQPHWAFIPLPRSIELPKVKNRRWSRNEIDRFTLVRLEKEKIQPSAEAERSRWLRRVSYDLTGLPPRPEEVDAFLADRGNDAYEKVVDRLLASKHFGERMAVPWLDAARYADSYGYQSDQLCPTWPYRDWVIEAFNRNLPYDQFLSEQLAGDLMADATRRQRLATAFNRLHRQTNEGGSIEEEWRIEYVSDRVHTFSTTVLALTFECARCHDHKYDPITQRDYYSLSAFFNSIDEYGLYNDMGHVPTPSLLLPTPEQEKLMAQTAQALQQKKQELASATREAEAGFAEWLKGANVTTNISGLSASFALDELVATNQFADATRPTNFSSALQGNSLVEGRSGKAIQFNGDDEITFPKVAGSLQPWQRYTVVFWLKLPKSLTNGVILHRSAGTDTGFHGTELSLKDGHLFFVMKHFWPGNAMAVRSTGLVPTEAWVQVAVSYNGSAQAEGITLYLDGKPAGTEIVRDHLYKSPQNGGSGFSFGALFRSTGLKEGLLDEVQVFNRPLAPIEVQQLFDGHALQHAIATKQTEALKPYYLAAVAESVTKARAELSEAVKKYYAARDPVAETSVMEETTEARPAYLLARGRYDAPKTEDQRVQRTTPAALPELPSKGQPNRLGLAAWLTAPDHPLTARVAVNRFWQILFGRGLVATPENFGAQGSEPTHPELLDWLARDFVNSKWDVKGALKKMVLSATYRQDSRLRSDLQVRDPENVLWARGPSQRLPAEMIRDTALAASGLLDEKLGGPPVSPYQPGDLWRESNSMSPAYHQSVGGDLYRRSVYTVWKRTAPMPDMIAFDAPSREVCVVKRSATSTPQQAFVLLNDVQFVEAARVLAQKALEENPTSTEAQIRFVFRRLTGRQPEQTETRLLTELLREQGAMFEKEPERAEKLIAVGERKRDPAQPAGQLAAMTALAQTVMNLDATVWKR